MTEAKGICKYFTKGLTTVNNEKCEILNADFIILTYVAIMFLTAAYVEISIIIHENKEKNDHYKEVLTDSGINSCPP